MPRATLRTRCGREVAIAYRLHSIETISEAALQGRVTAPPSAAATAAAQAAAAGPGSRAEADSMAAVLDQRPRGHGIFSTRSFDNGAATAAALSNRHSEPLPSISLRGLANGPTSDPAARDFPATVATRQGSTGLPLAALDSSSAAQRNGLLPGAILQRDDGAADEASSAGDAGSADGTAGSGQSRFASSPSFTIHSQESRLNTNTFDLEVLNFTTLSVSKLEPKVVTMWIWLRAQAAGRAGAGAAASAGRHGGARRQRLVPARGGARCGAAAAGHRRRRSGRLHHGLQVRADFHKLHSGPAANLVIHLASHVR